MTGKQAYREFLKSRFWLELSAKKRAMVGRCERCKCRSFLQSHHVRYPENWYDTTLEDLEVLCRKCHRKEHRIARSDAKCHGVSTGVHRFIIYRNDLVFSAAIHRVDCLTRMVFSGRGLRRRDEAFLGIADARFPPTERDSCMKFHVEQAWLAQEKFLKGCYT